MFLNLIGTSNSYLQIGALTDTYTLKLSKGASPTASLNLVFPNNAPSDGQVLKWSTSGSAFVWDTPSGFGTVITGGSPNDFSGTYNGDLVVIGDGRMTANTTIYGDLYISGNFSRSGGATFRVYGDVLIAGTCSFIDASNTLPSSCITEGNFHAHAATIDFTHQSSASTFEVRGSLYCKGVNASGAAGTYQGSNILVNGDAVNTDESSAQNITTSGNTANSGSITINGNCSGFNLDSSVIASSEDPSCNGGAIIVGTFNYNNLSSANTINASGSDQTEPGGNGGDITILGDCHAYTISSQGGAVFNGATDPSSGGDGGNLTVRGDLKTRNISIQGGDGSSPSLTNSGGSAGNLIVLGDLMLNDGVDTGSNKFINCYGGLGQGSGYNAGNGGNIEIAGCLVGRADGVNTYAGRANLLATAGTCGNILVYGDVILYDCLLTTNQSNTKAAAGNITVHGKTFCENIDASGSSDGDGGQVSLRNGANISIINQSDDASRTNTVKLTLGGYCVIGTINLTNRTGATIEVDTKNNNCVLQASVFSSKNELYASGGNLTMVDPQQKLYWYDQVGSVWRFASHSDGGMLMFAKAFDSGDFVVSSTQDVALFSLPANAIVDETKIAVTTAFDGTTPTAQVGVDGGDQDKYMETTENNLAAIGLYNSQKALVPNGSAETLELQLTCGGVAPTVGAGRVIMKFAVPRAS